MPTFLEKNIDRASRPPSVMTHPLPENLSRCPQPLNAPDVPSRRRFLSGNAHWIAGHQLAGMFWMNRLASANERLYLCRALNDGVSLSVKRCEAVTGGGTCAHVISIWLPIDLGRNKQ